MFIEREMEKLIESQKKVVEELKQLTIEVKSTKAYASTTLAILKGIGKEMEKLNKNLSKAGDMDACESIGNDCQCEKTGQ